MKRLSKILDASGKPIVVNVPKHTSRYDTARTSDENRKHWANADAMSARAANSPGVRYQLRNRSRYERDNDPYYGGLCRTIPSDLFGTGPRLQVQIAEQDDLNARIEDAFNSWADATAFVQGLLTAGEAKIVDGEPFGIMRHYDVPGQPVPLDIQWIEAEQCQTPPMSIPKDLTRWVDGIDLSEHGKPVAYHVLKQHPGDQFVRAWDFEYVPADIMLHWFRKARPGQYRGIPECTASLATGAQRRRWAMATLTAAELAADFAILVTSNLPADFDEEDLPSPFDTIEVERGLITTLPAGGDAHQMKTEHPGTEYAPFKHELLKEMGRPVSAPYSISGLDGSEHNYSSLRYEREIYHAALTVERNGCRQAILDRVFRAWYAIARLIPGYLAPDASQLPEIIPFGWYWPGFAAIDPVKEAVADTERLSNGTTTLQEVLAGYGQDYRVFLKQRAREIALMKELGIPLPKWADPNSGISQPSNAANMNAADNNQQPAPPGNQDNRLAMRLAVMEEAS